MICTLLLPRMNARALLSLNKPGFISGKHQKLNSLPARLPFKLFPILLYFHQLERCVGFLKSPLSTMHQIWCPAEADDSPMSNLHAKPPFYSLVHGLTPYVTCCIVEACNVSSTRVFTKQAPDHLLTCAYTLYFFYPSKTTASRDTLQLSMSGRPDPVCTFANSLFSSCRLRKYLSPFV